MPIPEKLIKKINKLTNHWGDLLKESQDINCVNGAGRNVLFILCLQKEKRLIKECITLGADINKVDSSGYSIFDMHNNKLWEFNSDFVKFLIENGANPLLTGEKNKKFYNYRNEQDYPWLLTYKFQKKLLGKFPEMYMELKYVQRLTMDERAIPYNVKLLHPKIEKEFLYLETGSDLGLLK